MFAILVLLIILVPTGLTELVAWKIPRREYREGVGYRSERANMTDATWVFAQAYSGRIGFNTALILLISGFPVVLLLDHFFHPSISSSFAFSTLYMHMIINNYLTEKKLKQLFDKNGNPIK